MTTDDRDGLVARIRELEAQLAEAREALEKIANGHDQVMSNGAVLRVAHRAEAAQRIAATTLAKLTGDHRAVREEGK